MKRTVVLFSVGAILSLVAFAQPADAQANGSASSAATVWDGVYTADQAKRGEEASAINCGACHSPAEWGNPAFITRWSGASVADLFVQVRDNMPYDAPGRLTAQEYADIVAYMLQLNSAPAGDEELPSTVDALDQIRFTSRAQASSE